MAFVIRARRGAVVFLIAAAVMIASAAAGQVSFAANWELADAQTVRLAPEKIEALSPSVRQELTRLGCTIPQLWGADRPGNFITGRFTSSTQTDVAVLCSRGGVSSILVFASGHTEPVAELAEQPDKGFLQVIDGNGQIGFSRGLMVARPQTIQSYLARSGETESVSPDHDGIEDAFVEKGSVVWYWHEGRWLRWVGSD